MDSLLDVDEIWDQLGQWGRYQRKQLAVCLLTVIPVASPLLCIVFLAYRPSHTCGQSKTGSEFTDIVEGNNSLSFVYHQCSIDVYTNETNATFVTKTNCVSGYDYDLPKDRTIVTEWDLVCVGQERAELTQTLGVVGQGLGATFFTSLSDRIGRKPVHIGCHITLFAITFVIAWSPHYVMFLVLRFFVGALQQGTELPAVIIALESVPLRSRYLVEIVDMALWTTGVALIAPLAYIFRDMSWRYLQMVFGVFSAYSVFEYWMLDESLRWLLANGKLKEAERILRKAARYNGKDFNAIISAAAEKAKGMKSLSKDITVITEFCEPPVTDCVANGESSNKLLVVTSTTSKEVKTSERYTALTIFKHKRILINSCILWYTWMTNSFVYFSLFMSTVTFSGDRYLNFFLMAIVEYPAVTVQCILIKRFGRRRTCVMFHLLAGLSLAASTGFTVFEDQSLAFGKISLAFNLIGKFAITGSFSTIFLYTPELYPTNLRNVGLGLGSMFSIVGGMLAPFAVPLASIVQWLPGAISSVLCLITVYLTSLLPETSKHELPTTVSELKSWYKANSGNKRRRRINPDTEDG